MTTPSPQILDVTVRDGSYLINHQFSPERVANIALGLQKAGIAYAEISHGSGIGAQALGFPALVDDEELLSAAKAAAPNLKYVVFISPFPISLAVLPGLVDYFDIGRLGLNITNVRDGEKFIQKIKRFGKKVSIQLVRTHARSPEFTATAAKQAYEMGADIIYVVDSFGSMTPNDVRTYVEAVKSNTKAEVGFHGHNNLGLALANTLTAWKTGATWLDASLMGVGRGAGNTVLEALVYELQKNNQCRNVDLKKLCEATQDSVLPIFKEPPTAAYIDLLFALEKLDYPNPHILELAASMLHVSLEELLATLHTKMGEEIMMQDTHLVNLLKEEGIDLGHILGEITKNKTS